MSDDYCEACGHYSRQHAALRAEVERLRGRESDALVEMQGLAVQRGISLDAATEEITFLRADLARAKAVVDAARDEAIWFGHTSMCVVHLFHARPLSDRTTPPECDCAKGRLRVALAAAKEADHG